jgi:4-amino-4-deoxy-L-arabinose transferase-like glycosyltransferase
MLDLPMAAFFTASIALWCAGLNPRHRGLLVLAGLAAALSTLSKYFGVALVPLLCVYAVACRRPAREWLPYLAIPLACLAVEQIVNYALYRRSLFVNAVDIATTSQSPVVYRIATGLSFTGGCIVALLFFSPYMLPKNNRALKAAVLVGIAVGAATIAARLQPADDPLPALSIVQLVLAAFSGVTLLAIALDDVTHERTPESVLLACWVLGTFIFASLLNWSVTARTILPMAPAAAILMVRRMHRCDAFRTPLRTRLLAIPLLACGTISFAVGAADYAWAESMRNAARSFAGESARMAGTVYFQGHWGWQYYMEKGGCRALDTSEFAFKPGDFVISPQNNVNVEQIPARYVRGVTTNMYPASHWVATMSRALGTGFYSDMFGPLPFAFGPVPADPYHVILLGAPSSP